MPEIGAEGMFALFDQYPDLLPDAPKTHYRSEVENRLSKVIPCCHCGKLSTCAYIAITRGSGRKWIDLCPECDTWMREAKSRIEADSRPNLEQP